MLTELYLRGYRLNKAEFEEDYLHTVPALNFMCEFQFRQPVTFFVGENGTGKSTLLEALAVGCGFNPEGGTKNFHFSTEQTHSSLYGSIHLVRGMPFPSQGFFLRAESFYNVATEVLRLADSGLGGHDEFLQHYGGRSLHEQSHGESFMALMLNRFGGNSIFFLDEPEAALSPARQMAFLVRMHELVQDDCQFIIVTHSPIIMAYPHAEILEFTETSATVTPYPQTEHYRLTRQFLEHPESMLHYLLEE